MFASGCGAAMPGTSPAPPIPNPAGTGELTEEDVNAWLDGSIPATLETTGVAGAAVSVVHDGEVLTTRGYGYSDTGVGYEPDETAAGDAEAMPVDPDETLFRIASVSKVFTATAVMQLVEAGEMDLDTDVNEYIDFTLDTSFDEPVTLRHLLTHTGGFEERIGDAILPDGETPDLRHFLSTDPPAQVYEPGTTPAYSNYGYALAGYVVAQVSGTSFDDYLDENVFGPTGMDSSTSRQPLPDEMRTNLSQGYLTDNDRPVDFETVSDAPAGAVTSTAADMARFMLAHLNTEGTEGPSLLSPETMALMQEPGLGEDTLGGLAMAPRMALGFFDEDRNGHRVIGHGGDTTVFHSHMQLYPEQGAGIFVTLNSTGTPDNATHRLRETLTTGFADRYFPAEEQEEGPSGPIEGAEERAAMLEGTYITSRSMPSSFMRVLDPLSEVQITARGAEVVVPAWPETGQPAAFEEIEPGLWREIGGQRTMAAHIEDDQVQRIGFGSAFTLLPADPETTKSVVVPVMGFTVVVLVLTVLSWPVGAVMRWRLSLPKRDKAGRLARVATRITVGSTVLAFLGWIGAISVISGLEGVPPIMLRACQAAQLVGMLGVIPAAVVVFDNVRHRAGWARIVGSVLVLAALLGSGWFAVAFNLVIPDITY